MANKPYAQIDGSLLISKKFRGLPNNDARFAYVSVHLSPMGNYLGHFRYPLVVWADEVQLDGDSMRGIAELLIEAKLIEYDFDEEIVRVVGWFYKRNQPENGSRMLGLAKDFERLGDDAPELQAHAVAEFAFGCIRASKSWDKDSSEHDKLQRALTSLLPEKHDQLGDELMAALVEEATRNKRGASDEIALMLPAFGDFIVASQQTHNGLGETSSSLPAPTLPTPCRLGVDTLSTASGHPVPTVPGPGRQGRSTLSAHETETTRKLEETKTETAAAPGTETTFASTDDMRLSASAVELQNRAHEVGEPAKPETRPTAATLRSKLAEDARSAEAAMKKKP